MASLTAGPDYSAVIVTFRRPEALALTLQQLWAQSHRPGLVVVADNDPGESARSRVEAGDVPQGVAVVYLPVGSNLGPAGGWARGAERARRRPDRGEWLVVLDDDDPLSDPELMATIGARANGSPPDVAAIGLRGAVLHRRLATLQRVLRADGVSRSADYLASGGFPWYRWSAVERVGFFDPDLFFGFEDLDLGLRLRAAGFGLAVADPGDRQVVADTSPERSPWREYYKTRALVTICRRHLGLLPLTATLGRTLVLAAPRLWTRPGGVALWRARVRGAIDGLRGRLGAGTMAPTSNPPK